MTDINPLIGLIYKLSGQDISIYEESFLKRSVTNRLVHKSIPDISSYMSYLSDHVGEALEFIGTLSIKYSEFFRNPMTFYALELLLLPRLMEEYVKHNKKHVRVWSAGCAAGQEAYSVAMILEELIRRLYNAPVSYQVFATDVSEKALNDAQKGVYDPCVLRKVPKQYLDTYFIREKDLYAVRDTLKTRIEFSFYDLLDPCLKHPPPGIYGDFDLIICSNLLFYYNPTVRKQILAKLSQALSPEGLLVTGEAEREIVAKNGFTPVQCPSHIFKNNRSKRREKE